MIARHHLDPAVLPTPTQRLVLDASLGAADEARAAFAAWRHHLADDAPFERDVYRLLPLLYRTLHDAGEDDPLMGRLKGVYTASFLETARAHARVAPTIGALAAAGIPTMLLKGAVLADRYYPSAACRPMHDVDLAVPFARRGDALAHVREAGYGPPFTEDARFFHSADLHRDDGAALDVHWRVFGDRPAAALDALVWDSAEPFTWHGIELLRPHPTWLLLHVLAHGTRWNEEPAIRWVPDAVMIVRARGTEIDWSAFVAAVDRFDLAGRVVPALDYLREHHDAAVPGDAAAALARLRLGWLGRLERRIWVPLRPTAHPKLAWATRFLARHATLTVDQPWRRRLTSLPAYLRRSRRVDTNRALVANIVGAVGRSVRARRTRRRSGRR